MKQILAKILPFIGLGVFLVLFVLGLILSFYLLLWGALFGLAIFAIISIKNALFGMKQPHMPQHPTRERQTERQEKIGRTFDHKDL